jgi:hypothetical protein
MGPRRRRLLNQTHRCRGGGHCTGWYATSNGPTKPFSRLFFNRLLGRALAYPSQALAWPGTPGRAFSDTLREVLDCQP